MTLLALIDNVWKICIKTFSANVFWCQGKPMHVPQGQESITGKQVLKTTMCRGQNYDKC